MNKPYITLKHVVVEAFGMALTVASIIYAAIRAATTPGEIPISHNFEGEVTGYGSAFVMLIMPISMLVTNLILFLCLHFLPSSSWNLPVKPREGKALQLLKDTAWLMVMIEVELAAFSLFSTLTFSMGDKAILAVTIGLLVITILTIVGAIIKIRRDNR